MGELSAWHWAIVAVVAMLLFGSRRLPDAARSIGRSARILRAELRAGTDSDQDQVVGGPGPGDRDPAGGADRPAEPARRPSAS